MMAAMDTKGSDILIEPKTKVSDLHHPTHGRDKGSSRHLSTTGSDLKRRKVLRACDVCRRKKIKCDGPQNSLIDAKCAHCEEYGLECTYVEAAKRRGPPKGYVETLEQRCGRYERILQQLHPHVDFNEYVGPTPDRDDFDLSVYHETLCSLKIPPYPSLKPMQVITERVTPHLSRSTSCSNSSAANTSSPSIQDLSTSPLRFYDHDPNRPPDGDKSDVEDEAATQLSIVESMSQLEIRDSHWRYHGKASGAHLMRQFQDLKHQSGNNTNFIDEINKSKRQQFWQVPEWEIAIANEGIRPLDYSIWPEEGLDKQLIDAYFDHVNLHLPLLNRRVFQRQYDSGMWKNNHSFSQVCLMVFANGSRFINDPSVYWSMNEGGERLAKDQDESLRYSAGWKYLRTLVRMGRSILQGPNLCDFQIQVLVCEFLQGSAVQHLMWILSGFGLRSAQEIGIHVRATLLHTDPAERALYNRAFWCLYHIDRYNCAAIGRSVAIQDSDFDADYPIDVDDEYWDTGNPEKDFKQPEGKVSLVIAFIQTLKLDQIIGVILQKVYAINKMTEQRPEIAAQRAIVVKLDSALNSWADNVPQELRWDPTRSDYRVFQQSAVLYIYYYYCQILIHRPFIPTPRNQHSTDLPSLAMCVNAARSICNISDAALKRGRQEGALPGRAISVAFMLPSWISAIILLIHIYSTKQTAIEREKSLMDIERCIAVSKELEITMRQSGKYTDFLIELSRENAMPDVDTVKPSEKRSHDEEQQFNSAARQNQFFSMMKRGIVDYEDRQNMGQQTSYSVGQVPQPRDQQNAGFGMYSEEASSSSASFCRGDRPFSTQFSPSTTPNLGLHAMLQPGSAVPLINDLGLFAQHSQGDSTCQHNMQVHAPQSQLPIPQPRLQQMPLENDAHLTQTALFDSFTDITSFESQLLDMSATAFGGQGPFALEDNWWSQLLSGAPMDPQTQD
ncbi:uncharacterized protein L203_101948 [Cryptococcus depauperatus CBS 7841]|uniref:Zn(2)-C6 fungal-type domain-containing protein n=1 Tax=Cryptococcus depauperatus CBS 7841 TaxID=1295531 RepID=A0AAJ8M0M5_9TREE